MESLVAAFKKLLLKKTIYGFLNKVLNNLILKEIQDSIKYPERRSSGIGYPYMLYLKQDNISVTINFGMDIIGLDIDIPQERTYCLMINNNEETAYVVSHGIIIDTIYDISSLNLNPNIPLYIALVDYCHDIAYLILAKEKAALGKWFESKQIVEAHIESIFFNRFDSYLNSRMSRIMESFLE